MSVALLNWMRTVLPQLSFFRPSQISLRPKPEDALIKITIIEELKIHREFLFFSTGNSTFSLSPIISETFSWMKTMILRLRRWILALRHIPSEEKSVVRIFECSVDIRVLYRKVGKKVTSRRVLISYCWTSNWNDINVKVDFVADFHTNLTDQLANPQRWASAAWTKFR